MNIINLTRKIGTYKCLRSKKTKLLQVKRYIFDEFERCIYSIYYINTTIHLPNKVNEIYLAIGNP